MRLRPLSLLLAPLWLLIAICVLSSCETPAPGPSAIAPGGGGGGVATAIVITVVPAGTTIPGAVLNSTVPALASPEPPTPLPTLASASLSPTELKYRVLDQFPKFFFCDPDFYPVARSDEELLAGQRFTALQNNQEEFQAILEHNHIGGASFTDAQKLLIYREHKKLAALHFQVLTGQYLFQITTGGDPSYNIQGVIDGSGRITVQSQTPGFPTCPICLAARTRIDTPQGAVLVEDIRVGDLVWTLGASGERIAAPVLKVARIPVSAGHTLLHIVLDDGRELWASPGHPTADGRRLIDLHAGAVLDGAHVKLIAPFAYEGPATYDLLPAGPSGAYWADEILMSSTLGP